MRITDPFPKKQIDFMLIVFIIVIGILKYQQISAVFLNNVGMDWAFKYLISEDSTLKNNEELDHFVAILNNSGRTIGANQFPTREVVIGGLYWMITEQELAKGYWDRAGIEPEFFIKKIAQINQQISLDYINRAIFLSPHRSELLYYKGLYFEENEDIGTARQWYALAGDYNNWENPSLGFDVFYKRGRLLFQKQQWAEAEEILLTALKFANKTSIDSLRNVAMVHRWLGVIYQQNGQLAEAKIHFLQAIELYPADFWNYLNLALIAEAEGQSQDIVFQYFDRARTIAPQDLYAYIYPAKRYFDYKQFDKWRHFCEKTPDNLRREPQWVDVCQPTQ